MEIVTNEFDATIEKAKATLFSIVGFKGSVDYFDKKRSWDSVFSSSSCHFWLSRSKKDGMLIRGTTFASSSPSVILNWLIERDLVTGIEGLSTKSKILKRYNNGSGISITLRTIMCKSGSIMSSNRDFHIITSISTHEDGSYVIATRSIPEDFNQKKKSSTNGLIRGLVHGSGFILRPWKKGGDQDGCEILYAAHLDMLGSRTGRINAAKTDTLIAAIISTVQAIQNFIDPRNNNNNNNSIEKENNFLKFDNRMSDVESQEMLNLNFKLEINTKQKGELKTVANEALLKMRKLHTLLEISKSKFANSNDDTNEITENWEAFYYSDDIVIKELNVENNPIGILSASCTIAVC
jgi:hypothetical protein